MAKPSRDGQSPRSGFRFPLPCSPRLSRVYRANSHLEIFSSSSSRLPNSSSHNPRPSNPPLRKSQTGYDRHSRPAKVARIGPPQPKWKTPPRKASSPEKTCVRIENLGKDVTKNHIEEKFSAHGDIINVRLDPSKGFGYIQYKNSTGAKIAKLCMNENLFEGKKIKVDFVLPREVITNAAEGEKVELKRRREVNPRLNTTALLRGSHVAQRGGSSGQLPDSSLRGRQIESPDRRGDSSLRRRRMESPDRCGDTPPSLTSTSSGRGPSLQWPLRGSSSNEEHSQLQ